MGKVLTPVGRIVWGNPLKGRQKTDNDNKPIFKDGVAVMQWAFGLAIPKAEFAAVWAEMVAEAQKLFPQGQPQNYAWKYVDGDGMDSSTPPKPFNLREGYAGCFVLSISTEAFAPAVFKFNGVGYDQFTDLKTGDFARVSLNIVGHAGKANTRGSVPGLYMNPDGIEFIAYGAEIFNGPDAMSMFGTAPRPAALPAGASLTPVAGANQPGMPGSQPMTGAAPGMQPGNAMPQPGMTQAHIAPAAAQPGMTVAAQPGQMPQAAIASPTSQPMPGMQPQPGMVAQPDPNFVANATGQRQPVGFDPATGRPIFGYDPATGQPIFG